MVGAMVPLGTGMLRTGEATGNAVSRGMGEIPGNEVG